MSEDKDDKAAKTAAEIYKKLGIDGEQASNSEYAMAVQICAVALSPVVRQLTDKALAVPAADAMAGYIGALLAAATTDAEMEEALAIVMRRTRRMYVHCKAMEASGQVPGDPHAECPACAAEARGELDAAKKKGHVH